MSIASFSRRSRQLRHGEQGYVLLTMLLAVSLMTIMALAALPDMIFELKRDQEQEMVHRGVQYTRAIRIYYRKFGRYPTSLNDLDNTNNLRYLRKHYKDPLTGKDFKLLHFGDPGLQLGGSFGGGTIPGATPAGAMNNASGSSFGNSFGSSNGSSFGGSSFGGSSFGNSGSSFGNSGSSFGNNGVNSSGVFSQTSSFGGTSNGGFGSNSNPQNTSSQSTDSSSGSTSTDGASASGQKDESSGEQQIVASGPIVGVASLSKKKTIRIFNKKTKYNEWQFIYDPTADRGGLITTPYQSPLQGFGSQSLQPGQNGLQSGTSSSSGSSFGQPSGFGGSSSFGGSSFGGSSFGQSPGFGNNSNNSGSNSSNSQQQ